MTPATEPPVNDVFEMKKDEQSKPTSKIMIMEGSVTEQKYFSGCLNNDPETPFPFVISPASDKLSSEVLVDYIQQHQEELAQQLLQHGAFFFRGFDIASPSHFDAVVNQGFQFDPLPYEGGAAPRTSIVGTVFTTNESPPESVIPFHHEMAQVAKYPKHLFFYCDVAPSSGGQTPLCRSDLVYAQMAAEFPDFCTHLEEKGVRYIRILPEENDTSSPIGRGWKSTYNTTERAVVEHKSKSMCVSLEWIECESSVELKTTTGILPAIRVHPVTKKKVWFNSLVAAYTGWQDRRNEANKSVVFGDYSPLPHDAVMRCHEILNELAVDIPWQNGDMVLIDNEAVLHARRPFTPPRKIYAALAR